VRWLCWNWRNTSRYLFAQGLYDIIKSWPSYLYRIDIIVNAILDKLDRDRHNKVLLETLGQLWVDSACLFSFHSMYYLPWWKHQQPFNSLYSELAAENRWQEHAGGCPTWCCLQFPVNMEATGVANEIQNNIGPSQQLASCRISVYVQSSIVVSH